MIFYLQLGGELDKVGVPAKAIEGILQVLTLQSLDDLEGNVYERFLYDRCCKVYMPESLLSNLQGCKVSGGFLSDFNV